MILGKCIFEKERETLFITQPDSSLGTPDFMPIEQWESAKDVDERSDIYSLGASLYSLLTAKLPYGGCADITLLYLAMVQQKRSYLREKAPLDTPVEMIEMIEKMMAFEADHRYPTSKKLLVELLK
jgi:serine/threonine protein kinase